MFKKLLPYLKNKYVYTTLAFFIWMFFFDKNNIISQAKLSSILNDVKYEKQYYLKEIKTDKLATKLLKTDTATLEKFAREKYLMKKDNEDIFLIVKEDKAKK
ncbi:MAG: septum formation initiator family protein [Bacteroidales bacterium]|nr:septum formation initiator family protein [Bacteroidales bacterium]